MRVLVAPLEMKGTLRAEEVARAMREGILRGHPDAQVELSPLADGGPGTLDALAAQDLGLELRTQEIEGPHGKRVRARWGLGRNGLGIVEMAEASGLQHGLAALTASTHGTGELIAAALDAGCTEIWVGLGGSATTDGGTGAATALGARCVDSRGRGLPQGGGSLRALHQVKLEGLDPRLSQVRLLGLTGVDSPLLGPAGAARLFGPQKGATPADVEQLERGLARLAEVTGQNGELPGSGAAGGLGFGLMLLGGSLVSGFERIAAAARLDDRIRAADWVLTGEGRFDAQTSRGKGPGGLAARALALGKPTVLLAGQTLVVSEPPFESVISLSTNASVPTRDEAYQRVVDGAEAWARKK